ncbi:hypothetical protein RSAG8_07710, partial [Rhizoctonia solani AG-8 WAC10335]
MLSLFCFSTSLPFTIEATACVAYFTSDVYILLQEKSIINRTGRDSRQRAAEQPSKHSPQPTRHNL